MAKSQQELGAGILFVAPGDKVLLLLRGNGGDHAGEWCLPGGHRDYEETPAQTAVRESDEEAGTAWHAVTDGPMVPWTVRQNADMKVFTTYVQRVTEQFPVTISDEHVGSGWFDLTDPPKPLHPGCKIALDKFFLDELGIARAIAAGELTSPQKYANVTLYALRITGTGHSYRPGSKEYVWRPPEHYLDDEFLARCNGLPVVWLHPDNEMMTSDDFKERVIGTVMLPYVKGDEVWGVAKIYDEEALAQMEKAAAGDGISTSPGVWGVGNNTKDLGGGEHALFEEKPLLLDHLAVVDAGVWDKGGSPSGVSSTIINHGELDMTDKANTAEGASGQERKDALTADKEPIDHLLSRLDSAMGKLDAACARMDAYDEEQAKRDRKKQAKKDRKARMDALRAKKDGEGLSEEESRELAEMERAKADKKAKKDSEEAGEAHKKEGNAIEEAKAEHEKEGAAMDKGKKDASEAEGAKHDALEALVRRQAKIIEELSGKVTRVESAVAGPTREDEDALLEAQARYDSVLQLFGTSAPRALAGERPLQYRKRLGKMVQGYSTTWKDKNLNPMEGEVFDTVEAQILGEARKYAFSADSAPPNKLVEVKSSDATGRVISTFKGDSGAFLDPFRSPTRRVSAFHTNLNQTRH